MAKLAMGTPATEAFQHKIEDELVRRGYTSEKDAVMAEYITIMVINDKTAEQINAELVDLLGAEYESNFTDWLFEEATNAANPPPALATAPIPSLADQPSARERASGGASLLQSALSGVHPSTGPTQSRLSPHSSGAQKRSASARSPSPSSSGPNKARRTDTPTGPRAMMDRSAGLDRPLGAGNRENGGRSLIDRVGGPARRGNFNNNGGGHNGLSPAQASHIQAKIDNITGSQMPPFMNNGQGPMPMNPNPQMLQEMMMMNWDLMRQMATSMGVLPQNGMPPMMQPGFGFGQPGMPLQPGAFGPGMQPGFVPPQQAPGGRGGAPGRGGAGRGRGRGGAPPHNQPAETQTTPTPAPVAAPSTSTPSISVPDRPTTPSLCKYALKCTNPQCRYAHPSPVATPESGMVLSTEFCPQGKDCKDKDCKLGHVSPSVVNGVAAHKPQPTHPPVAAPAPVVASSPIPCKFGLACTRPGCMFTHPPNFRPPHPSHHQQPATTVPCRFGNSCTRSDCPFQHPKGHVPPNMFYRGLGPDAPLMESYISPHKSVRFGTDGKAAATAPARQDKTQEPTNKEVDEAAKVGEKTVDVGA